MLIDVQATFEKTFALDGYVFDRIEGIVLSGHVSISKMGISKSFEKEDLALPILNWCKKARVKLNDIKMDSLSTAVEFKELPDKLKDVLKILEAFNERISKTII